MFLVHAEIRAGWWQGELWRVGQRVGSEVGGGEEVRSDEKCTINYNRDIRDIKSTEISL